MKFFENGIPSINFSEKINQLLINDMAYTVVIKLSGKSIESAMLHNKIFALWKPNQPFRLMDIANGYFLDKFQNPEDYERVLSQDLWIIFDQYLIVQPWSIEFDPEQSFPSVVML